MKQTQELIKLIGLKSDKQLDELLKLIQVIDSQEGKFSINETITKQIVTYSKTK